MNRTLRAVLVLSAMAGAVAGCDDSARRQRQEANEAIDDVQRKTNEAEATAQKARADADKKIAEARKEAADELNEAQRKVAAQRADVREDMHKRMAAVDKQIEDLKTQSARATGKIKDDIDRTLAEARTRRTAIEGNMRSFEASADAEVKAFGDRLDKELDELESVLRRGVLKRD